MFKLDLKDREDFLAWAARATAGVDQSGMMLGVVDDTTKGARWEFALQIGHCLLEGKPLVLIAEEGTEVPEKLRAAATVVEFYQKGNEASMQAAAHRALEAVGRPVRH